MKDPSRCCYQLGKGSGVYSRVFCWVLGNPGFSRQEVRGGFGAESSTFYLNIHTRKQKNCRLKTCLDLWPAEFLGSAAGGFGISGPRRTFVVLFWVRSWSSCEFGASGLAGELL